MVTDIEVNNLRGIREGRISGLTNLSVLVGVNGSGKSTLLDAVLIGASASPVDAVTLVVQRRSGLADPGKWLFGHGTDDPPTASVTVEGGAFGAARDIRLGALSSPEPPSVRRIMVTMLAGTSEGSPRLGQGIDEQDLGYVSIEGTAVTPHRQTIPDGGVLVRLVEPGDLAGGEPLSSVRTQARERGRHDAVRQLAAELIPGLVDITVEDAGNARAVLYLDFGDHILPEAVAGDGVRALLRACYELAAAPSGIVLIEEPEVHLHPGAMRLAARAMHAAAARDVQVIISTHSIEIIDFLISEAGTKEALQRLSVHRVRLENGVMRHRTVPGQEAAFLRGDILEDLR